MLYTISCWFLFFIFYSIIGYFAEIICVSITCKKVVLNRGFLIGPYLPIYGIGASIIVLFLQSYQYDLIVLFVMAAFSCTLLEYFTSLLMEEIFNLRWWDYSGRKFNIEGRVCLENSLLFGLGGVFIIKVVHPIASHLIYLLSNDIAILMAGILFLIFFADIIESSYITFCLKNNITNFTGKDATREIKKEVLIAIKKHTTLTSRLLRAFPNISYTSNKKLKEFLKVFDNTKREIQVQKLKRKLKEAKSRKKVR